MSLSNQINQKQTIIDIGPQPGPQTRFLQSTANICIYGGAGGGGKTFGLMLDPIYHYHNPKFVGVIFRRTTKQIRNPGGLWEKSFELYSLINGIPRETSLDWVFPSGMNVTFAHMEHENNKYDWQGTEIPFLGWDELTHFTIGQFFYLLSRNRSTSGVPGYVRATCNPDSKSWVRKFIDWWIDNNTGLPIPSRSGKLRWFIREDDKFIWADTRQELINKYGAEQLPTSVAFIPASVYDNPILLQKDPGYLAKLHSLPRVEREQLLGGNWNVSRSTGDYFKRHWFEIVESVPRNEVIQTIRYWDRAATEVREGDLEKDPDYTVGVKLSKTKNGIWFIEHITRDRLSPYKNKQLVLNTAKLDGVNVHIGLDEDPGSAGKSDNADYVKMLSGFIIKCFRPTNDKTTRALPFSSQCEAGNVKLVRGSWNEDYLSELENFPDGGHDDQVDASSGAFNALNGNIIGDFSKNLIQNKTSTISNISSSSQLNW